ncbi:MAG: hypothetical protein MZV65_44735 [Chromatiales bacterium]|nr:hypothetical protein [Chromatiales bacterium]
MPIKRVLCPERLRSVPAQFSWVDHRLVRDRHIDRCDAQAGALYLFLVTVADAQGLSYYSDAVLARRLSMAPRPPRPGARRSAWRGTHRLSATPLPSPGPGRAASHAGARTGRRRTGRPDRAAACRPGALTVIDYEMYCKIQDCHERQGLTIAQTARSLGVHEQTVATWLKRPQYQARHSPPAPASSTRSRHRSCACWSATPTAHSRSSSSYARPVSPAASRS